MVSSELKSSNLINLSFTSPAWGRRENLRTSEIKGLNVKFWYNGERTRMHVASNRGHCVVHINTFPEICQVSNEPVRIVQKNANQFYPDIDAIDAAESFDIKILVSYIRTKLWPNTSSLRVAPSLYNVAIVTVIRNS